MHQVKPVARRPWHGSGSGSATGAVVPGRTQREEPAAVAAEGDIRSDESKMPVGRSRNCRSANGSDEGRPAGTPDHVIAGWVRLDVQRASEADFVAAQG